VARGAAPKELGKAVGGGGGGGGGGGDVSCESARFDAAGVSIDTTEENGADTGGEGTWEAGGGE
jgi:hypothetical protein